MTTVKVTSDAQGNPVVVLPDGRVKTVERLVVQLILHSDLGFVFNLTADRWEGETVFNITDHRTDRLLDRLMK